MTDLTQYTAGSGSGSGSGAPMSYQALREGANIADKSNLPPLNRCPALILNADYRPLSYFPLSLWTWQDAVRAIFRGTVTVVSEYDRYVHSTNDRFKLPSVLALKEYAHIHRDPAFTRFNVFFAIIGSANIAVIHSKPMN